jgi:hypothetical protein
LHNSVAIRASELPLHIHRRIDDLRSFEGSVTPADRDSGEDAETDRPCSALVGVLEPAADEVAGAGDGSDRRIGQRPDQVVDGRAGPDSSNPDTPGVLDFDHPGPEGTGVALRTTRRPERG